MGHIQFVFITNFNNNDVKFKMFFSIAVPPENISMLDDKGFHIPHYILGPYNEGE